MCTFVPTDKADANAVNALANVLAEEAARATIESACFWQQSGDSRWYDTRSIERADDLQPVGRAVRYLRMIDGEAGDYVATFSTAFPHLVKFTERE